MKNVIAKTRERPGVENLDKAEKVKRIGRVIRRADSIMRERYPILKHQDGLALVIFWTSVGGMVASSYLYLTGLIPAWACVVANGIFASFLHELEHDLIHYLYFKKNPLLEKFVFYGVWLLRGNTIDPYARRKAHLLHHSTSGREADVEERSITNGMPWSPLRLWALLDLRVAGALLGYKLYKDRRNRKSLETLKRWKALGEGFPLLITFYILWDLTILYHAVLVVNYFSPGLIVLPGIVQTAGNFLGILAVLWLIPNIIRQSSLVFISSNMHYYGDFEGHLLHQTQVLNRWFFLPLQLFCFNFGSTHGIHHFVVNQPFYLRQMSAPWAHKAMAKYGVRFNDLKTFKRANRFYETPTEKARLAESIAA